MGVERSAVAGLKLYPNPSEGIFLLESEQYRIEKVSVLTPTGQMIVQEVLGTYTWPAMLSGLPSGVYLLKVDTEVGVWQEKLLVR